MTCGQPSVAREGGLSDRIRLDLEQNILSGKWPAGHRIASENELTKVYSCSRMTVNKAIAKLVASGLLERNKRAGTTVRQPTYQSAVSQLPDICREITESGKIYDYKCLKQRVDHTRGRLEVICLHFSDGEPLVYEERLIDLQTVPEADHVDFSQFAPSRWLIENVPWSNAENKVSAINAGPDIASHLAVATGSSCLLVERDTWANGNHVTHVRQFFRGDCYQLNSRFKPSGE
jgi:histidine utilization repressor